MNTLITKEFEIAQPIDIVWKSLANPEEIVGCVPGASITEKIDDRNYKGKVVTKFGPIKATYNGDIEIVELDEANHEMVLKGRGLDSKGKGSADMIMNGLLTKDGEKTLVKFSMDITIVGMLAQFGSRLIKDVSEQLLNQFIEKFSDQLEAQAHVTHETTPVEPKTVHIDLAEVKSVEAEEAVVENVQEAVSSTTRTETTEATTEDNAFDGASLISTVIKSTFGGIFDFFKSLLGGKK